MAKPRLRGCFASLKVSRGGYHPPAKSTQNLSTRTPTTDSATAYTKSTPPQAPLQGSWIGEAKTEGLFRFAQSYAVGADISDRAIRTKFIDPHLVGTALAAVRYRRSRYKVSADLCGRGRAPSLRPELNQHGAVTKPAHPQPRYKTAMP